MVWHKCIIIAENEGLKRNRTKVFASDGNIDYCRPEELIEIKDVL
jgi:hypothetical protein